MKNYKAMGATMMQWGKKNVVAQEGEAGKKQKFFMFRASRDDVGKLCTLRWFIYGSVPYRRLCDSETVSGTY